VSTNIGFKEYFHMLCGLQLFVGAIPRSMMPLSCWLVPVSRPGAVAEVKAMVGWIKWPQFARDKYLLHTCKTRRV
jgi:hypothetical protein